MAGGPTVRRRRLAAELRRLRDAAGKTLEEAAAESDVSRSTLSRIENGQVGAKVPTVRALLSVYGVEPAAAQPLLQLAREANQRGWWHQYSAALPSYLGAYLDFEQEAVHIRQYSTLLIPGLLQVEAYARDVLRAFLFDEHAETVESRLQVRLTRQTLLDREDAPRAWFVLDEAALRRDVGGPAVMRQQLEFLRQANNSPNVRVQILPYNAGAYPAMDTPFSIMDFRADPSVVYLENPNSAMYLEQPADVAQFVAIFDHMRAAAESLRDSALLIRHVIEELPSDE